jgi:hypothetical protein
MPNLPSIAQDITPISSADIATQLRAIANQLAVRHANIPCFPANHTLGRRAGHRQQREKREGNNRATHDEILQQVHLVVAQRCCRRPPVMRTPVETARPRKR